MHGRNPDCRLDFVGHPVGCVEKQEKGREEKGRAESVRPSPRPARSPAGDPAPFSCGAAAAEEGGIPMDDPFGQMMMEAIREARRQSEATAAEGARAVGGEGSRSMAAKARPLPGPRGRRSRRPGPVRSARIRNPIRPARRIPPFPGCA